MKRKPASRSATTHRRVAWCPEIAALFDKIPEGWEPPQSIICRSGVRTISWMGIFACPDGSVVEWMKRGRRSADGHWHLTNERLSFCVRFKGKQT
jgi:hypothetical protein